ncbi:MAG: class I SAM-dependent methyltransferase [bacterium]|nr:class I SAM-dependent methyltransferase [bacterium]
MLDPAPDDPPDALRAYYSHVAEDYARSWGPVLAPLGEMLVAALALEHARVVVDAGAGTGSLLPALGRRASGALVVGADLSEGMLRVARSRSRDAPLAVMDAQRLALGDSCVDALVLAFMLFHVPDPVRALREAGRTLRPGGEVGLATWVEDRLPGAVLFTEELDAHGASEDPMPAEVRRLAETDSEEKLAGLLRAARLTPVRTWTAHVDHAWTAAELLDTRVHCGGHARRLRSLAPEARSSCVARVRARLEHLTPAELVHKMEAVFAVGRPV